MLLASVHEALFNVYDDGVRDALRGGLDAAIKALADRGGAHIEIHE